MPPATVASIHIPAFPLAAVALFAIVAARARREMAQQRSRQRSKTSSGLLAREQQISM